VPSVGDRARSLGPGTSVELPHLALRSRLLGFGTWVGRVPLVASGPDRSGPSPARGSLLVVGRS